MEIKRQCSCKVFQIFFFLVTLSGVIQGNSLGLQQNSCGNSGTSPNNNGNYLPPSTSNRNAWCVHELVPDLLDSPPNADLQISFGSTMVNFGEIVRLSQVQSSPTQLYWPAEQNALYTLIMSDPDAISRQEPTFREFLHWMVGNLNCYDPSQGDIRAPFIPSGPPEGTGLHRYAFVVFKQPGYISFDEPKLDNSTLEDRILFNTRDFANKYGLELVAGNFYQTEFEPLPNGN